LETKKGFAEISVLKGKQKSFNPKHRKQQKEWSRKNTRLV
jgi:hypothetical protein